VLLSVDELWALLFVLDVLDEPLEDALPVEKPELSDGFSEVLSDKLSEETDELSETLSEPDSYETVLPAQPVNNSITDKTNAADLVRNFFIIRSFDKA